MLIFAIINLLSEFSKDFLWLFCEINLVLIYHLPMVPQQLFIFLGFSSSPSQIACMITNCVYVTCTQTVLCMHKNLCTALIPLCKNNLNQLMCLSSFFLPCAWLPPLVHRVVMIAPSLHCLDFFCLFFAEAYFVAQS